MLVSELYRFQNAQSNDKKNTILVFETRGLYIMIKFGNNYSTSVDNKWLPQKVNLEEVQNTLPVDKKVSECHTVAM